MSQLMLAIDTSQGTSVAILAEGKVLAERTQSDVMAHAETIGVMIREVLDESGHGANEVGSVVCGVGPGPFTGLRIGIAAAKFFAEAVGAELFGVISLDAIALDLELSKKTLVYTDARRGEVYYALYQGHSRAGIPNRIAGPSVAPLQQVKAELQIAQEEYEEVSGIVSAAALGRLALLQISAGVVSKETEAMYLRAPDAVPSKGKKVSG